MARINYEEVARDYRAGRGLSADGLSAWRDRLRPLLHGHGLPIVDVGSGTGQFAELFPEWFDVDVVGVEPSDAMRAEATRATRGSRVTYLAGDAANLPLEGRSCQAAWLSTVIHHVPDLQAAAKEIRRVVIPGGPVLIRSAFPTGTERISLFRFFPEAAEVVKTFPSIEQVRSDFAAAGFVLESVEAVPQVSVGSLSEFRDRAALRADTTLRWISDDAFAAGLARIDATIASGEPPGALVDYLDLVVLR